MKKKTNKQVAPSWHPNFRVSEGLPDIKVVRTDFLVNIGGIILPAILICMLLYSHISESGLESRIADLESQIQLGDPGNKRYLRQNKEFKEEQEKLEEIASFLNYPVYEGVKIEPISVLLDLVESRPEFIAYRQIGIREREKRLSKKKTVMAYSIQMTGSLRGSAAEELLQMDEFQRILNDHPRLGVLIDEIETVVRRNASADVFDFTMTISLHTP